MRMHVGCMRVAVLAAVLTGCSKKAQPQPLAQATASPESTAPQWQEFSHQQGKFAVLMPGTPQEVVQELPTAAGKTKMTINVVELKDQAKAFAVIFADLAPGADYTNEAFAHKVLDGVLAGVVRSRKGEVQRKSKIKLGSHYGQESYFENAGADTKHLCRVYLVENRLYQLFADWSTKKGDTSADAEKFINSFKVIEPLGRKAATLTEARQGFKTKLTRRESAREPVPVPPAHLFRIVRYDSPAGPMAAYLTPDPKDRKRHPAIIWITGGDCNSIDQGCWKEGPPSNDQSASAFRKAGIVMMFPSLRGGNNNPGDKEGFLGEIDDLAAAADYLGKQEFVDPKRVYLGGHSTGGTLVLLAAECTDRFRAVFSFGPVGEIAGYDPQYLPFDRSNGREFDLRSPARWLRSIRVPTFVFEGTDEGNLDSLQAMARASTNPKVHFLPVRGASHFSILAPTTRLIANKVLHDNGAECNLTFTEAEVNKLFAK